MRRIKEAVIVEGRYDKNAVLQAVDCTVIETHGFGIFNSKEQAALLRKLSETCGLIVFTDSDSAGFLIRNHIKGVIPGKIKHAYIPDIYGKERRKSSPSKEGKLGVEGMSPEIIVEALRRSGATFIDEICVDLQPNKISKADFYLFGLSGGADSSKKREAVLKYLGFPSGMTTNALLQAVNMLYSRDDFAELISELSLQ